MAILAGCANESQVDHILANTIIKFEASNASSIGVVLYPPYPDGFFSNPIMDQAYEYQNGGLWDWFAGRFILAEYHHGFSTRATHHLHEIAAQDIHAGGLYEWYTPEGSGRGSTNFTGSAGVLGTCIIEGYFGIQLSHDTLTITPRLAEKNGSITLTEPMTGTDISYNYRYLPGNAGIFEYESNYPDSTINILMPEKSKATGLVIDGYPREYTVFSVGNDTYVSYNLTKGKHHCTILLSPV